MNRREFFILAGTGLAGASLHSALAADRPPHRVGVCVYGGTASGIAAAVAAAREGCRVLLIEPSRWLGGMTGGGLVHIDWGRPQAVGGSARKWLKDGLSDPEYRSMFKALAAEHGIEVLYEHRLGRVERKRGAILSVELDYAPPDKFGCPVGDARKRRARTVNAAVYIDCSYEGDLMAQAGVSYTYGRESREMYGETLAGVRPDLAVYDIDPYRQPGNRRSGLIPLLQDLEMPKEGSADRLTMGYGFRWKFSKGPDRLPLDLPEDYDPFTFEIYRRGYANGVKMTNGRRMRKLGVYDPEGGAWYRMGAGNLSRALVSPTVYGCNAGYPDGDWKVRSRIWRFHQDFMRGLTHFLCTDPSVPAGEKQQALSIGFQPGMFDDTSGWPHQMYVREARRMKSAYVVSQKDLEGQTDPADSVGLASYGVDDWPYATYVRDGKVALQGGEFSVLYLDQQHKGIYIIPYRSIVPLEAECSNLLVPVCCSVSHIAMTSLRMEPVWMILGESAGVAAALSIRSRQPVQQVSYPELRARLRELNQILERPD